MPAPLSRVHRAFPLLCRRIPNKPKRTFTFPSRLRFLLVLFLHSQQNRGAGDFPSRPFSFTFVNRQWESDGRRSTRPGTERCRKISECLRKGDAIMADEEKKCCGEGCSCGCREGEASECHSESGCQCHAPKKGSCACGPDCHCEGCQEGKACTCHHE